MAEKQAQETYSEEEAAKRRDEALRRALSMPPNPEKLPPEGRKKKSQG